MLDFIGQKLGQVFSNFSSGKKDLKAIEQEVFNIFMDADVPFKVSQELASVVAEEFGKISKNALRGSVKSEDSLKYSVYKVLSGLFQDSTAKQKSLSDKKFWVTAGSVGSGKTTSTAKLAYFAIENMGYKNEEILVASIDNIRNAGSEQLGVLCKKIGVEFLDLADCKDSAWQIQKAGTNRKLVLIDTPGQLSMNKAGLVEIREFCKNFGNRVGMACIVDAMIGQASLSIISDIQETLGIDLAVLTKVDSEAKGGVVVGFAKNFSIGISFICDGENVHDMQAFQSKPFVQRLLGYGDIDGLSAKIESCFKRMESSGTIIGSKDNLVEKIKSGQYDFQTMLDQIKMMDSMGPLSKLISYMPGFAGVDKNMIDEQQSKFAKYKVIVQSMTKKEMQNPDLLSCRSRKQRIAHGAGISMAKMDEFLKEFAIMKKNIKMISSFC